MTAMLPVVILAGGQATRLRPVTESIPKSLVEVGGEPFLAKQLRLLHSNGIDQAVLCIGYRGEMIRQYAGDGARFGMRIQYSEDGPSLLGTGGAIARALPLVGERFFTVYGDSYLPCDYAGVQGAFLASGKLGLMTVFRNEDRWDTSNVEFSDGQLLAYDKKNPTPRMAHIDYGLGVFHRSAFAGLTDGEPYDLAFVYQDLLARGELAGFEVFERFYEIGSFAGIEELAGYLAT
jgi:NDP-sugar pyrophosphorylase family protein